MRGPKSLQDWCGEQVERLRKHIGKHVWYVDHFDGITLAVKSGELRSIRLEVTNDENSRISVEMKGEVGSNRYPCTAGKDIFATRKDATISALQHTREFVETLEKRLPELTLELEEAQSVDGQSSAS